MPNGFIEVNLQWLIFSCADISQAAPIDIWLRGVHVMMPTFDGQGHQKATRNG